MMSIHDKIELLKKVSLFKYTEEAILEEIAKASTELNVSVNDSVVVKGEFGDDMYIIAKGALKVHDENHLLAEVEENAVFGELAALSPRSQNSISHCYGKFSFIKVNP